MKYLKYVGYYLLFLILIIFLCSLLNLIKINSTITNFILFITNIVLFLIMGFKNGNKSSKKGYLAGLKISLVLIVILFIINIILKGNIFTKAAIIYYFILILSGTFGGMIGISKKKEETN